MDEEEYKELHLAIVEGDLDHVRRLLPEHTAEQYFSYEDTSALYKAFYCEEYEIASYLIHKGAKIHNYEVYDLYRLRIDLTRVNYLLFDYNKRSEKSSIFRLLSYSQSPQGMDGERLNAVMSMYEEFFNSEILKLLMDVLEYESFDIVYDFESEDVNRIHRLYEVECEIYGLTLSNSKEIFVGAKHLLSGDSKKKAKVYGVVAEELCHLALTNLFENNANPYREEHSKLSHDFVLIMKAVKSLLDRSCHVESVIKDVFENYEHYHWECELIARVPHVIGIYGEELGRRIFLESPELSRLLIFYEQNVLPKCHIYSDPSLNTKLHHLMEQLTKKNDFVSFKEKQIRPLKEGFPSFREYLVDEEGISVITANSAKLCVLHVYHELKRKYEDQLEKKCLFFTRKCFAKKSSKILDALNVRLWDCLILMLDEKELHLQDFKDDFWVYFNKFKSEGLEIIIISASELLGQKFQKKAINYKWNDLTDEFQALQQHIRYFFKGEEQNTYVLKEDFPKVFDEEDIQRIISGELIEVCDGMQLFSQGYIPETYIEREFQVMTVDRKYFENLPPDTSIFIYGMCRWDFKVLLIDEKLVQWLTESDCRIQEDKSIFIIEDNRAMNFEDFLKKSLSKTNICLRHEKKVFNLMDSNSCDDIPKQHIKRMTITEDEMIDLVKSKRIIIISDNAGCGKSTIVSSLIKRVKRNIFHSWVWRIDLSKFSTNEKDFLSIAHIKENGDEEEVLDHLFLMIGINNGFEKLLFKEFSRYGNCFIFFDGFDEIPLKYKAKAVTLISTVSEKTCANIIITTRIHQQKELEGILNTYSHQLVPFCSSAQVSYLGKLWKWKMKFPNREGTHISQKDKKAVTVKIKNIIQELGKEKTEPLCPKLVLALEKVQLENSLEMVRSEIDNLDFTELAENILKRTLLDEETLELMGIPLHLFMIGTIYYDGNFHVALLSDIFHLFSQFIEQKILIYLEEKQGLQQEGRVKDDMVKIRRGDAYRIHMKLADLLIDEGKHYLASEMNGEDRELCSALGIVFIHGEGVNFLHQTFAEFFKAESLRQWWHGEDFVKMLFEEKYNVVRRFLWSALEKKSFENLRKEFFEDGDFLAAIVVRIVDVDFNLDIFCLKIVKKLLESFEEIVDQDLVNKFIVEIESRCIAPPEKHSFSMVRGQERNYIGGCLTVHMLKKLITRNFSFNSSIIFSFVLYSLDHCEIIDVLEECILVKAVGECRVNRGNEMRDAETNTIMEFLRHEDSKGIAHALSNDREKIFVHLLKMVRIVLGKEQFVQVTFQSYEYWKEMKKYMENKPLNKICCLLKEIHSVFGNEMKILVEKAHKFSIIYRAVKDDNIDDLSNSIETVISLFHECFGSEEFKEFLLSESNTNYLIHNLLFSCSNRNFMKILNSVREIVSDDEWYGKLLTIKGRSFWNVFHLAAKKGILLDDILKFCRAHIEKKEIKEIILSTTIADNNVMDFLFLGSSSETLRKNVNLIKETLGVDGYFKQILMSKGDCCRNIFHLAALKDVYIDELLEFKDCHLEKDEIMEILLSYDICGYNVLHTVMLNNSSKVLIKNLNLMKNMLDDDEQFKHILKSKGHHVGNIFHIAACRDMDLADFLQFCDLQFDKFEIQEMLLDPDKNGYNVMHLLFRENFSETLMKNLNLIKKIIGDDDWFKKILKNKSKNFENIFHISAVRDVDLADMLKFCKVEFDKNEMKEMLLSNDADGYNVIHLLFRIHSPEKFIKNMELLKEIIGDDTKQLLMSKDNHFCNIFHFAAEKDACLRDLLLYCSTELVKEDVKEMLLCANNIGYNVMHLLVLNNSSEKLKNNLNLIMEMLSVDELHKHFLMSKGNHFRNIFHLALEDDMFLEYILKLGDSHLEKECIKEMLLSSDENGDNLMNYLIRKNNSEVLLVKNLNLIKAILGDDECFKQFLKNESKHYGNIFHVAAFRYVKLDEFLQFCNVQFDENEITEMLQSTDGYGSNVLHILFWKHSSENFIKILNLFKEILGYEKLIKQLLISRNNNFCNIFHLTANRNVYLRDLMQFYSAQLEKEDIKELLLSANDVGYNVLHTLVVNNDSKVLMMNLNLIKECVGEWFKEIFMSKGIQSGNIFHTAALRDMDLGDLLQFCNMQFGKGVIKEMLFSTDKDCNNVMLYLFRNNSSKTLIKNLHLIKDIVDDCEWLKELTKIKSNDYSNMFHLAAERNWYLEDLLRFSSALLEKDEIKELLLSNDKLGLNVFHALVLYNSSEILMKNLEVIKEFVGNDEWFKELIISKVNCFFNIFHLAAYIDIDLLRIQCICDFHLKKEEIKEMLFSTDDGGDNVMHYLIRNNSPKWLMENLNLIKDMLCADECFKQLLMSRGSHFRNVFHLTALKDMFLDDLLQFYIEELDIFKVKEMLISPDENGYNVLHVLLMQNSSEMMMKNLSLIMEVLGDEQWFKQLLKCRGNHFGNMFHLAALRDMDLEDLLQFCNALFERDEIREMLLSTDEYGDDVMHYLIWDNSSEILIKNLNLIKEILDDDQLFVRLAMSKCNHLEKNDKLSGFILNIKSKKES